MKKKIAIILAGIFICTNLQTTVGLAEENEPVVMEEQISNNSNEVTVDEAEGEEQVLETIPEDEPIADDGNIEKEEEVIENSFDKKERQVINIDEGWQFNTNDTTIEGWQIPSGISNGVVNIPHCWEYVHPKMLYLPQMNQKTVTYQKTVDISAIKNKNLFIKFYGSARNTQVFVDNQEVGTHIGGYSSFVFDITEYAKEKNEITITVNVTNLDTSSIPINVDYTQWGGIYRDVELISTSDQYISLEDYGNTGVYIDSSVNGLNANINLKTEISNKAEENSEINIRTEVFDKEGNIVIGDERIETINSNSFVNEVRSQYEIKNVHLWNGTIDPYLYMVKITISDKDGNILDSVSQKFGVRTISIKNGKVYLNGNEYEIHGVGFHQDREGYGNAVPDELKEQDFDLMQEMGVNAVRTSHYPHSQSVYEMADERGILVYCEIPYYLLLSKTESYKESIREQLKEMIRQGYNHPSIMMWGIQNEVYYSDRFASFGNDFKITEDELIKFNSELVELAKSEDQNRFIVQAEIDENNPNKIAAKWSGNIDFTGVNLYVGFKSEVQSAGDDGRAEIIQTLNDKINNYKKVYSANDFMLTEYGAGGNVNQHAVVDESFSWAGNAAASGQYHYEEYQSYILETYLSFLQQRNDIPISFVWNMFDFSCYRNEGGIPRTNTKGLVCYNHVTRKDAYYLYKANWNKKDKFVYLTSKRYTERINKVQQIKVYSNCENVELYINGNSVGEGRKQQDGVFVWDDVKLDAVNELKAVGFDDAGNTYTDEVNGISVKGDEEVGTTVKYQVHVQDNGWLDPVENGEIAGTVGESKRMEAIKVALVNKSNSGNIEYRTHVQNEGWMSWVKGGKLSGTSGKSLRMEAIQLKLTGDLAKEYDIYYRVHAQNFGWLDWAKNGQTAGTSGYGYRLEAIEIRLVKKGKNAPGKTDKPKQVRNVSYQAHVQNIGDTGIGYDGDLVGTVGKTLRMEAIKVSLPSIMNGSVEYKAHVQNIGWQGWRESGKLAGTKGKSLRMEAVKIRLTGEAAKGYDIYYQVHVQNIGWLDWAKNGEPAGSEGYGYQMEAIRIKLVEKGGEAPGKTNVIFKKK